MKDETRRERAHLSLTLAASGGRMPLADLYEHTGGNAAAQAGAFWGMVRDGSVTLDDDLVVTSTAPRNLSVAFVWNGERQEFDLRRREA